MAENKKGRLVVIEGIDGSGKSTQYERLKKRLVAEGIDYRYVSFPNYKTPSGEVVKRYLNGNYGGLNDVNPYAASSLFAVDRCASFLSEQWGRAYQNGGFVLAARYTTSNAVHQASRLEGEARLEYFKWLEDFEYGHLGLPKPDAVFYLALPAELAVEHIARRAARLHTSKDIHERNTGYLQKCAETAEQAAEYFSWQKIAVTENGRMLPASQITDLLYAKILLVIGEVKA